MKNNKVSLNVPVILTFDDYHEIKYVRDYFNKLIDGKVKIKSKELTSFGEYAAIFYFNKLDEECINLIKNYKIKNDLYKWNYLE